MTSEGATIENRLKSYIESVKGTELGFDVDELSSKHLINDLGMDSLDIINMLFQIEEAENVDVSESDMESHALFDFHRLADHIRQKRHA